MVLFGMETEFTLYVTNPELAVSGTVVVRLVVEGEEIVAGSPPIDRTFVPAESYRLKPCIVIVSPRLNTYLPVRDRIVLYAPDLLIALI